RAQFPGIHGAIVELIQVPDRYETAMEIALGGAMQHIVVENEEVARKAIHYLKAHAYGRATFLPMNVMQPKTISSEQLALIKDHPSFVGIASELIHYDSAYRSVIANLLGNVIITTDLKGANELARLLHYRYRLVTLDGDVVSPGGAMTGGGIAKKANSLLSRNRELETITAKLHEMEQKTEQLERFVQTKKKMIHQEEAALLALRKQIEEERFALQEVKSELREVQLQEKNMNERLALYDHEKANDEQEAKQMTEKLAVIEQQLCDLEEKLKEIDRTIETLQAQKQTEQTSK
ncbi:chromosome segregation protein SMC, partial [Parageobacillus sp. SY1]